MKKQIPFSFKFKTDGPEETFFMMLPFPIEKAEYWEVEENSRRRVYSIPPADVETIFEVVATALLSSSVVATAIKSWIEGKKRKITIEIVGTTKKLQYEGPNLKEDSKTIEAIIDRLSEEAKGSELQIKAVSSGWETEEEPG